jgi:hypothetical protein
LHCHRLVADVLDLIDDGEAEDRLDRRRLPAGAFRMTRHDPHIISVVRRMKGERSRDAEIAMAADTAAPSVTRMDENDAGVDRSRPGVQN